ncbi:MAG: NAD(P)-binding domain-containing protein [Nocardioides sp.]|uniref:NAD(P)-binding domain-containing protein n=1 Tax=Nocardioides sp. TaxID=35761 RepID=UPI0032671C78
MVGRALGLIDVTDGPPTYGILGVGALGEAIVTGLCREIGDAPAVVLSPRSASTAAVLAESYPTVRVEGSNQDVVDASDVVVVCLRQTDIGELAELSWRPDQVPAAMALFERLGGAIPIEGDEQYDAIFTGLGTVAPFYEYLGTITSFLTSHGLPDGDARRLVAASFAGVAAPLADPDLPDFAELLRAHATPGGGNDQLATLMREAGVSDATRSALDEVHRRQTTAVTPQ